MLGAVAEAIFASLAEFKRDLISERTKAGLAFARGRPERRRTVQEDCH